ncbi:MAG: hypothetical protein WC728_00715 [Elusimicrobiota bacterium]
MRARVQASLIAAALAVGCGGPGPGGLAWEVLLPALPSRIVPESAGVNTVLYILKQTHEPLFRKDDGQRFESRVLRQWSRAVDSTSFTFCVDGSRTFDAGKPFSTADLQEHISRITGRFDPRHSLMREGDCVSVAFERSRKDYLDFLTRYENAPSLKTGDPDVEMGLGPFKVQSMTSERIVLSRKSPVKGGYDSVVLHFYRGPGDPNLQNRNIADFNRVLAADVPAWVADEYQSFGNTLLKSYNLVINYPDPAVRRAVFGCMDTEGLRRAYFPGQKDFYDLKTLLPVGVPGARAGKPTQTCPGPLRGKSRVRLVFVDWRTDNEGSMREFVQAFARRTGIEVEVKPITLNELVDVVLNRPHPYQLAVIALDAVRPDHSAFFDYVLMEKSLIDYDLSKARALYARMALEDDGAKRNALASELAEEISREAAVLPLFQDLRRFYYPKGIRNLVIGKGFLEYPEVGELRR